MRGLCKTLSIEHLYNFLIAEEEKVSQASLESGTRWETSQQTVCQLIFKLCPLYDDNCENLTHMSLFTE